MLYSSLVGWAFIWFWVEASNCKYDIPSSVLQFINLSLTLPGEQDAAAILEWIRAVDILIDSLGTFKFTPGMRVLLSFVAVIILCRQWHHCGSEAHFSVFSSIPCVSCRTSKACGRESLKEGGQGFERIRGEAPRRASSSSREESKGRTGTAGTLLGISPWHLNSGWNRLRCGLVTEGYWKYCLFGAMPGNKAMFRTSPSHIHALPRSGAAKAHDAKAKGERVGTERALAAEERSEGHGQENLRLNPLVLIASVFSYAATNASA